MVSIIFSTDSIANESNLCTNERDLVEYVSKPRRFRIWIRINKETRDDGNGNTSTSWGLDAGACTNCNISGAGSSNYDGVGVIEYDDTSGAIKIIEVEFSKNKSIEIPKGANLKLTIQPELAKNMNSPQLLFETKLINKLAQKTSIPISFSEVKPSRNVNKPSIK